MLGLASLDRVVPPKHRLAVDRAVDQVNQGREPRIQSHGLAEASKRLAGPTHNRVKQVPQRDSTAAGTRIEDDFFARHKVPDNRNSVAIYSPSPNRGLLHEASPGFREQAGC